MYNLEITKNQYKYALIVLMLLSIPSTLMLFYGIALLTVESYLVGNIVILIGLSGFLLALSALFTYIKCSDAEYNWQTHIEVTDKEELVLKVKPFSVHTIKLNELKQIDIKKEDTIINVLFITEETELKCQFTKESYDSLLFLKRNYILGW